MPAGTPKVSLFGGKALVPGGNQTFNSPGNFTVPVGVTKVNLVGKGGAGNAGSSGNKVIMEVARLEARVEIGDFISGVLVMVGFLITPMVDQEGQVLEAGRVEHQAMPEQQGMLEQRQMQLVSHFLVEPLVMVARQERAVLEVLLVDQLRLRQVIPIVQPPLALHQGQTAPPQRVVVDRQEGEAARPQVVRQQVVMAAVEPEQLIVAFQGRAVITHTL